MITTFVPYDHSDTLANLGKYFKEKNALRPENAISMEHIDWLSISSSFPVEEDKLLKQYPFLKKTESDKFWFDSSTYIERQKKLSIKGKKILLAIGLGLAALIIGMFVVSFIINFS